MEVEYRFFVSKSLASIILPVDRKLNELFLLLFFDLEYFQFFAGIRKIIFRKWGAGRSSRSIDFPPFVHRSSVNIFFDAIVLSASLFAPRLHSPSLLTLALSAPPLSPADFPFFFLFFFFFFFFLIPSQSRAHTNEAVDRRSVN